jgi:hypothetical protein
VGGFTSQLAVPKASAQQAATLPKWELHWVRSGSFDEFFAQTQAAGAEGWELPKPGELLHGRLQAPKM